MTGAPPPSNTHYARVPPVGVDTVTPTCPPYPYDPSPGEATNLAPCARSIILCLDLTEPRFYFVLVTQ